MNAELTVIIAVSDPRASLPRLLAALRGQTIATQLEIVVVRASPEVPSLQPESGFASFAVVDDIAATSPDRALAAGFAAATAPYVWLLEDHAFPEPDCAERLLAALEEGWTVVGCAIASANVGSARLAQAGMYIGYGSWAVPVTPGPQENLPNHNVAYRRAAFEGRDELPSLLDRGSAFHSTLAAEGAGFYLADARVLHINPSGLRSALAVRFNAGRLYGADRAVDWGFARRVGYAGASPLIPLVRFRRIRSERFGEHERAAGLWPRLAPAVAVLLVADAAGQAIGNLIGRGRVLERLALPERHRIAYVNRADRLALFDGG